MRSGVVRSERGYALPFALVSLVVFSILITTYFSLLTNEYKVNTSLVNSWKARYLAESGVENALYKVKIGLENNGNPYSLDLTQNAFVNGSLLPPNLLGLSEQGVTNLASSGEGTLADTSGQTVGTYEWAIFANGTEQVTPSSAATSGQTAYANVLTYKLTIQSVGTLSSSATKYRINQVVDVTFVPLNIPESAVSIVTVSQSQQATAFGWEGS